MVTATSERVKSNSRRPDRGAEPRGRSATANARETGAVVWPLPSSGAAADARTVMVPGSNVECGMIRKETRPAHVDVTFWRVDDGPVRVA